MKSGGDYRGLEISENILMNTIRLRMRRRKSEKLSLTNQALQMTYNRSKKVTLLFKWSSDI